MPFARRCTPIDRSRRVPHRRARPPVGPNFSAHRRRSRAPPRPLKQRGARNSACRSIPVDGARATRLRHPDFRPDGPPSTTASQPLGASRGRFTPAINRSPRPALASSVIPDNHDGEPADRRRRNDPRVRRPAPPWCAPTQPYRFRGSRDLDCRCYVAPEGQDCPASRRRSAGRARATAPPASRPRRAITLLGAGPHEVPSGSGPAVR